MGKISRILITATIALLISIPTADASKGIALIIGNDQYKTLPNLNNAANDAKSMAKRLTALGWDVILEINATRRTVSRALSKFENKAAYADASLVFYAGHGIESSGINYLIPSDSNVEVEADLRLDAIKVNDLLIEMKNAGTPINILILDSCRDNPLEKVSRGVSRGLSQQIIPSGSKGTAILYAAAPGQAAEDGPAGGNGIFTGELLKSLNSNNLLLDKVFKTTASEVGKRTENRQNPWISTSLSRDFQFGLSEELTLGSKIHTSSGQEDINNQENAIRDIVKNEIQRTITKDELSVDPLNDVLMYPPTLDPKEFWYKDKLYIDRNGRKINTIKYKYYIVSNPEILKSNNINPSSIDKSIRMKIEQIGLDPGKINNLWWTDKNYHTSKDAEYWKQYWRGKDKKEPGEKAQKFRRIISQEFTDNRILEVWNQFPGIELTKDPISHFKSPGIESILYNSEPSEKTKLTLDIKVIEKIDKILEKYAHRFKTKSIFTTLINSKTFEIIAINNLGEDKNDYAKLNNSIQRSYEFGSVLMPLTYAIGLDSQVIVETDVFSRQKPIKISRFTIKDFKVPKYDGWISNTLSYNFLRSSSIVASKIALAVGRPTYKEYLSKFGLLSPIKVFPDSNTSFPNPFRTINIATIGYGHGIAITQVHLAKIYATLSNGGLSRKINIFKPSKNCIPPVPGTPLNISQSEFYLCDPPPQRLLSKRVSKFIKALLFSSVERGTSRKAGVKTVMVGGKTGTAELPRRKGLPEERRNLLSSFVAAFPIDRPKYVLAVSLKEPKGDKSTYGFATGGWVAAPAAAEIVEMLISEGLVKGN
jgi:hypothetical protein